MKARSTSSSKEVRHYKRILAPVDGSHTSTLGLEEAVQLAKDQRAKLRIVHVVDESVLTLNLETIDLLGNLSDGFVASGKKTLKNARALAGRHGVKAEGVITRTSPAALPISFSRKRKSGAPTSSSWARMAGAASIMLFWEAMRKPS